MSTRRGGSKATKAAINAAQAAKTTPAAAAPPSHPIENLPQHRAFLNRSLSRNDEDLSVIIDLNRTLHKVKQNIVDACGEELLLDLGEGLFELTPDGRDIMVALPSTGFESQSQEEEWRKRKPVLEAKIPRFDNHRQLCVDFLLRMKLRRRLMNRFVRRLNRVAHAMDGEDISPPMPPKYGDLRLRLDPKEIEHYRTHQQYLKEARERIEAYRRENPDSLLPLVEVEKKNEEDKQQQQDSKDAEKGKGESSSKEGNAGDAEEDKTENETEKSKTGTGTENESDTSDAKAKKKKEEQTDVKKEEIAKSADESATVGDILPGDKMDVDPKEEEVATKAVAAQVKSEDKDIEMEDSELEKEGDKPQGAKPEANSEAPAENVESKDVEMENSPEEAKQEKKEMLHDAKTEEKRENPTEIVESKDVEMENPPEEAEKKKPMEAKIDEEKPNDEKAEEEKKSPADDSKVEGGNIHAPTEQEAKPPANDKEEDKSELQIKPAVEESQKPAADDDASSSDDMFATSDKEDEDKKDDEAPDQSITPGTTSTALSEASEKSEQKDDVPEQSMLVTTSEAGNELKEVVSENFEHKAAVATEAGQRGDGLNEKSDETIAEEVSTPVKEPSPEKKKEAAADALMAMFSSPTSAPTTPTTERATVKMTDISAPQSESPTEKDGSMDETKGHESSLGVEVASSQDKTNSMDEDKKSETIAVTETLKEESSQPSSAAAISDKEMKEESSKGDAMKLDVPAKSESKDKADVEHVPGKSSEVEATKGGGIELDNPATSESKDKADAEPVTGESSEIATPMALSDEGENAAAKAKQFDDKAEPGGKPQTDKATSVDIMEVDDDQRKSGDKKGDDEAKKTAEEASGEPQPKKDDVVKPEESLEEASSKIVKKEDNKESVPDDSAVAEQAQVESKEISTAVKNEDGENKNTMEDKKEEPGEGVESTPKPDEPQSTPVKDKSEKPDAKSSKETGTPRKEPLLELPPLREMNQLEKDSEILKDFVDAYEKELDPVTGAVSYTITKKEDHQEDYELLQFGAGIGAQGRSMSVKEKEVEFQRWQTALLSKIPEAPTFEELGMKNCVFKLAERRKRLHQLQEEKENPPDKKRKLSHSSPSKGKIDPGDSGEKDERKPRNIGAVERKSPKKEKEEAEKEEEVVTKKVKPLSLAPLPSFYDSDLRRIRMIHGDLMFSSMYESSQKRVNELTMEYNKAFNASNAIFDREQQLKAHIGKIMMGYRQRVEAAQIEHEKKKAIMKERWQKEKARYDANRMKKYLPSNWRNTPVGTTITQKVCNHYPEHSPAHVVSNCLADVVDGVIIKLQSNAVDEPFRPFEEPPFDPKSVIIDSNTGETLAQHQQRVQLPYQKEAQALATKLAVAEDERKRVWKKLAKAKQEFESPEFQAAAARMHRGGTSGAPPLRSSTVQPAHVAHPRHHMSSYAPNNRGDTMRAVQGYAPSGNVSVSDSRYSAARVKERIGNDGSVAPVTAPKQGPDGYFQRPAGRQRKGMEWDHVNGVWVPRNN